MIREYDVVVVGGGIAGLCSAFVTAKHCRVAVVSKVHVTRSHSVAAQGGIAASLGNEEPDTWEWHMFDTVKGSDYLADQDAVEIFTKEAPEAVIGLERMGVPFSRNLAGKIEQRRFGGHTRNFGEAPLKRACYVSDRTGRAIMDSLYDECLINNVAFYNEVFVQKLLFSNSICCGVAGFQIADCEPVVFHAKAVVLATGGCGRIFKVTSNGFASTGDGLVLTLNAGLSLEDMEFVQFHPTGLYSLGILLSEAARAEGGILINGNGERFMEYYAPTLKDLAPRDIVSRAILTEINQGRGIDEKDYVHLDLRALGAERIARKLPEISSLTTTYLGIDPSVFPVPVAPTCHYIMGGIPSDTDGHVITGEYGDKVKGLYAVGECACVSLHGANRLGCNSLIDLVVFGKRVGINVMKYIKDTELSLLPSESENEIAAILNKWLLSDGTQKTSVIREAMQRMMTEKCSVFRNSKNLTEASGILHELKKNYDNVGLTNKSKKFNYELTETLELGNMLKIAEVIVFSALQRKESRGGHYRSDCPERNDEEWLKHTIVHQTDDGLRIEYRPVVITRFLPEERRY